ncbi:Fungal lipase-like domain [Dillenia turbinata]|uniref:Fungal lipase-like domain n=1 Tax=Dillenia turbinata TaxID=194707 RepID=A0AAN8VPH0_9MAGN
MEAVQSKVESWIRDQRVKILKVSWPPQWTLKWPWTHSREQKKKIQEEYEKRKRQIQDLCFAVKADSVSDLQDILCCMVLSECVYKRPATEMVRAVNKFKADFGGQVVSLERVQPSSDHVTHRDVMADANILQGAIFHGDGVEDIDGVEDSDSESAKVGSENIANGQKPIKLMPKVVEGKPKPAAHRGFLARAKGIPALELYRLAQKKKRKLVLCGHSLGGAVAVLATLAILRVVNASTPAKESEKVQIKCITFSQPPVGNAALRDYVHSKGWHNYFKTYCIPEDLVPRILSPAYFHHYNAQPQLMIVSVGNPNTLSRNKEQVEKSTQKPKENEGERLVLGLGPVQNSFWRLSRLVPLEGIKRQINRYKGKPTDTEKSSGSESAVTSSINVVAVPQSLEIQEGSDGVSLKPVSDSDGEPSNEATAGKVAGNSNINTRDRRSWRSVPYLPSYVPFGQLYLLGNSSVEHLSGAEYSKMTSVRSVIAELRERFQSHSMRSYRSRFQRMYDLCMSDNSSFLGMEQLQQFPHLQQWLGLSVAGTVELGHIVESPVIRTATSLVPLGWTGNLGEKNGEPLKVDITGFGLHLCTLVHAQPELQKMRILVGSPLRQPPKHQIISDSLISTFPSIDADSITNSGESKIGTIHDGHCVQPEGLANFIIYCISDFNTISKVVQLRTRRVKLIGLEGAGKTSLFKAILGQGKFSSSTKTENMLLEDDLGEGIAGGLCYLDSEGVNLQELNTEVSRFKDELWMGIHDLRRKIDLIVLVHNLSHRIPSRNHSDALQQQPALSLLLDEAKALGIPWILAVTNKFSVSAHQQRAAIEAVLKAYQASPSFTEVINSCPYVLPSSGSTLSGSEIKEISMERISPQKLIFAPINFVWRPFQRKAPILPVEGVTAFCQLAHHVLRSQEEASRQEFAHDRLLLELAREHAMRVDADRDSQAKSSSMTAAAVGASLGAGLGIVLAVVMGAASALRKP